jgi:hypothetical protein
MPGPVTMPSELATLLANMNRATEAELEAFKHPWGNAPAPDTIFHYTKLDTAKAILDSGTLWLSDIFQMNDPSEISYGVEHAIELVAELADGRELEFFADRFKALSKGGTERSAHYFALSFSHNGDELGQWRAYADDATGVALGFDGNILEQAFATNGGPRPDGNSTFPIFYEDAKLRAIQENLVSVLKPVVTAPTGKGYPEPILRAFMSGTVVEFAVSVVHLALYFKHHAYKAEDEYRFLNIQRGDMPAVGTVDHNTVLGPCRHISFDWKTFAPNSLKEIVIGPAADEARARASLERWLDSDGYDLKSIKIRKSPMPYRSMRK